MRCPHAHTANSSEPKQGPVPLLSTVMLLAITADGAVWSWGQGGSGCLGHGDLSDQMLPKKIAVWA